MSYDPECIFCKIAQGSIPSKKIFEDEQLLAFHDIHPAAPIHALIIPKTHIHTLGDASPEHTQLLGRILLLAPKIAQDLGATEGFRAIVNNGPGGGQEVYHLHLHVLGGPRPWRGMP